jgi:hypothetical protein
MPAPCGPSVTTDAMSGEGYAAAPVLVRYLLDHCACTTRRSRTHSLGGICQYLIKSHKHLKPGFG